MAVVVAPSELVEVALQPAVGNLLVVPTDARLEVPEEPFDGVRVNVAVHVVVARAVARTVTNPTMGGEVLAQAVVGGPHVRVDDGLRLNPLDDLRLELGSAP